VAPDGEGRAHNINADTVAGELAAAMQAEKLVLLTDTAGILRDRHDPSSLIRQLSLSQARQLIAEGIVDGGMTPKTECCIRALAQGVGAAHIIDGRVPHYQLLELVTNAGTGKIGYLEPAAFERTVKVLLSSGSSPVIKKDPGKAAYSHVIWEASTK
jgi:acetylglutamate kinase